MAAKTNPRGIISEFWYFYPKIFGQLCIFSFISSNKQTHYSITLLQREGRKGREGEIVDRCISYEQQKPNRIFFYFFETKTPKQLGSCCFPLSPTIKLHQKDRHKISQCENTLQNLATKFSEILKNFKFVSLAALLNYTSQAALSD